MVAPARPSVPKSCVCDSALMGPSQDALCLHLRLILDGSGERQLAGSQTAASPNARAAGVLIPQSFEVTNIQCIEDVAFPLEMHLIRAGSTTSGGPVFESSPCAKDHHGQMHDDNLYDII